MGWILQTFFRLPYKNVRLRFLHREQTIFSGKKEFLNLKCFVLLTTKLFSVYKKIAKPLLVLSPKIFMTAAGTTRSIIVYCVQSGLL